MKKFLLLLVILISQTCAFGQINVHHLSGSYSLVHFYEQNRIVTTMNIAPIADNKFEISGDGWIGEGEITGNSGYYMWEFNDGRKGRTNFVINENGQIIGHVLGAMPNPELYGLDWTYLALPENNYKSKA
jgi:hypothetical protein